MRAFRIIAVVGVFAVCGLAQSQAEKIFDTEKAFERAAAQNGINAAFVEFLAPTGVMLTPFPVNGPDYWGKHPASNAVLSWEPTRIEVASNGILAYSIGTSEYRANGKGDPKAFYGHYITVWGQTPNGDYRALLDAGVNHEKPKVPEAAWRSSVAGRSDPNSGRSSAADSSTAFYETVDKIGAVKAYKNFLADDVILLRDGKPPIRGKGDAVDYIKDLESRIRFPRRKAFIESADLAYVYDKYSLIDKNGKDVETGGFVQVWKFRRGKWLIAAEAWIPAPKAT